MGRTAINGGVLVINHEHKKHPLERSSMPYSGPEFLASQNEPIVATRELFDAWRVADHAKIRELIFPSSATWSSSVVETAPNMQTGEVGRRWWLRRH